MMSTFKVVVSLMLLYGVLRRPIVFNRETESPTNNGFFAMASTGTAVNYHNQLNGSVSIVMAMICRNEAANLRLHLHLWLPFVQYFVFVLDHRNDDDTEAVIAASLGSTGNDPDSMTTRKYTIITNEFTGFGQARTVSLEAAWHNFPQATHVWLADPDWRPLVSTIHLNDLATPSDTYSFIRTLSPSLGGIKLRINWIVTNKPGNRMKYHVHEVIDDMSWDNNSTYEKSLDWMVEHVGDQSSTTWHAQAGHGHWTSMARLIFDLSLLGKDLEVYGDDSNVFKNLCATHYILLTNNRGESIRDNMAIEYHASSTEFYCRKLAMNFVSEPILGNRWMATMLLGEYFSLYKEDFLQAEYYLRTCHAIDPLNGKCIHTLFQLYRQHFMTHQAIELARQISLLSAQQAAAHTIYFGLIGMWECFLPLDVLEGLLMKLRIFRSTFTVKNAKYLLLLKRMIEGTDVCQTPTVDQVTDDDLVAIETLLASESPPCSNYGVFSNKGIRLATTLRSLCADPDVQEIILVDGVQLHSCAHQHRYCQLLRMDRWQPPQEECRQFGSYLGAFSASVMQQVAGSSDVIRILLAEHFNMLMVLKIIGYAISNPQWRFEIVVILHPLGGIKIREFINSTLKSSCLLSRLPEHVHLHYFDGSLFDYHREFWTMVGESDALDSEAFMCAASFHYVEYYAMMSDDFGVLADLTRIKDMVRPEGIVGLTYFSSNAHLQRLIRMLSTAPGHRQAASHSIDESVSSNELISAYLEYIDEAHLARDFHFLNFVTTAAMAGNRYVHNEANLNTNKSWSYSRQQIRSLVNACCKLEEAFAIRSRSHDRNATGAISFKSKENFVPEGLELGADTAAAADLRRLWWLTEDENEFEGFDAHEKDKLREKWAKNGDTFRRSIYLRIDLGK